MRASHCLSPLANQHVALWENVLSKLTQTIFSPKGAVPGRQTSCFLESSGESLSRQTKKNGTSFDSWASLSCSSGVWLSQPLPSWV